MLNYNLDLFFYPEIYRYNDSSFNLNLSVINDDKLDTLEKSKHTEHN